MKSLIARFKASVHFVKYGPDEIERLRKRINDMDSFIRERTTIGVDLACTGRDPTHVIVMGHLAGKDYVRTYNFSAGDLQGITDWLRRLQRQGRIEYVDGPPHLRSVTDRLKD